MGVCRTLVIKGLNSYMIQFHVESFLELPKHKTRSLNTCKHTFIDLTNLIVLSLKNLGDNIFDI